MFSSLEKFSSKTSMFSTSDKFSETFYFSTSEKFSESNMFSFTNKFSESAHFSSSKAFSKSTGFSLSDKFTRSNYFSKSASFSTSFVFSESNEFSKSMEFTPSFTLPPSDFKCGVYEDDSYFKLNECYYSVDEEKLVFVYVLSSSFVGYQQQGNGSAICLTNCGIYCNGTNFISCVSISGGGGAVFINNSFEITNNATFYDANFTKCKADFGGALFIYAQSELFNISMKKCHFKYNTANLWKPQYETNSLLYGGSAMFLMCTQINVFNCTFARNFGKSGAVKVYNLNSHVSKRIQLEERENSISFFGCQFEQNENSPNSIFYDDKKSGNGINIVECNFNGKLSKKSHYIDGKMIYRENLYIESCKFETERKDLINIDVNENELSNEVEIKHDFTSFSNNIIWTTICIYSALIILVILICIKLYYLKKDNSEFLEEEDYLNISEKSQI